MNFKKLFLPAILCSLFFATSCDSNDDEYNEVVLTLMLQKSTTMKTAYGQTL